MSDNRIIRETGNDALSQILALYPLAFPDEDLQPIVSELLGGEADVLSLAAYQDDVLTGHVLFTLFSGEGEDDNRAGALLAPLGVLPAFQKQGVGSALVRQGLARLKEMGIRQVFVLGDPNYYSRFGFEAEQQVKPPYPLPQQWQGAWLSMLPGGRRPLAGGRCILPEAWMQPDLWLP